MANKKLLSKSFAKEDSETTEKERIPRCPNCKKEKAIIDPIYGVIMCEKCQTEDQLGILDLHEFTSESIKTERVKYSKSMLQPFVNGALSKEYVEAWGTSKLAGITKQDIKNAKYTYKDLPRYHKFRESKI